MLDTKHEGNFRSLNDGNEEIQHLLERKIPILPTFPMDQKLDNSEALNDGDKEIQHLLERKILVLPTFPTNQKLDSNNYGI